MTFNNTYNKLYQRISVLVQRFNAVLLLAADCTDWRLHPPLYCLLNF